MQFPIILKEGEYNQVDLDSLLRNNSVQKTCDVYTDQLSEYFEIINPRLKGSADLKSETKKYIDENSKRSPQIDKNNDTKILGQWISGQQVNYKKTRNYKRSQY